MTHKIDKIVFPYTDRDNASISVKRLDEPYGDGSPPVLSIGCSLKGKPAEPTWVVHIPMNLVPSVANSMLRLLEEGRDHQRQFMKDTSTAAPGF